MPTRTEKMQLAVRRVLSGTARLLNPDYSYCYHCMMPWSFASPHNTYYTDERGCFPLCEFCWRILRTPRKRIVYYRRHFDMWACGQSGAAERWAQIRAAVFAGK